MVTFLVPKNKEPRLDKPGSRLRCALIHQLDFGMSYLFFQEKRRVALSTNIVEEWDFNPRVLSSGTLMILGQ